MSRTNHYRICEKCKPGDPCWRHERPWSRYEHKPARTIAGRRMWTRKARWPRHSPKIYHNPPPRWWWQEQHSKARAIYRQMIVKQEDPALPKESRVIDLYGWY